MAGVKTDLADAQETLHLAGSAPAPIPAYFTMSFNNDPNFTQTPVAGVFPDDPLYYNGIIIPDPTLTAIVDDLEFEDPASPGTILEASINPGTDYLVDPADNKILQIAFRKTFGQYVLNETVNRIAVYTAGDILIYIGHYYPTFFGSDEVEMFYRQNYQSEVTLDGLKAGDIDKVVIADARLAAMASDLAKLSGFRYDHAVGTTQQLNELSATKLISDIDTLSGKVHILEGDHPAGTKTITDVEFSRHYSGNLDLTGGAVITLDGDINGKIKTINATDDSIIITGDCDHFVIDSDNDDCLKFTGVGTRTVILNGKEIISKDIDAAGFEIFSKTIRGQQIHAYYYSDGGNITVPDDPSFEVGTGDFTIVKRFRTSATGSGNSFLTKTTGATGYVLTKTATGDFLRFAINSGGNHIVDSNGPVADGEWHITAIPVDRSGNITMWLDGDLQAATAASPSGDLNNALDLTIASSGAQDDGGTLIFNRLLITAELKTITSNPQVALNSKDEGGSNVEKITSWNNKDFDTFTSLGTDISVTISGANGDNCYSALSIEKGKTYRWSFTLDAPWPDIRLYVSENNDLLTSRLELTRIGNVGVNTATFTADADYLFIGFMATATGTKPVVSDWSFIQLGTTINLDGKNFTNDIAHDSSGNGNDGAVTTVTRHNKQETLELVKDVLASDYKIRGKDSVDTRLTTLENQDLDPQDLENRMDVVEDTLTGTDGDTAINKLHEMVSFLASFQEGQDLLTYIKDTSFTFTNKFISGDDNDIREVDSIKDQTGGATSGIKLRVVEIGAWNMDVTSSMDVPHGLTLADIVGMTVFIIDDGGANMYPIDITTSSSANRAGSIAGVDSSDVILDRYAGEHFDSTSFDDLGVNRGFINIFYKA